MEKEMMIIIKILIDSRKNLSFKWVDPEDCHAAIPA